MVILSQADAVADIKTAISGRIQAIANVHSLFVATRGIGAELSTIAGRVAPYSTGGGKRVRIDGPQVLLEPDIAQAVAVTLHELVTNAAKYGAAGGPMKPSAWLATFALLTGGILFGPAALMWSNTRKK
jgi:two-component sensor histidine kinase